jgi:twitching motility protein PilT
MPSLKALLAELSGSPHQRLELMSGRRPRLESDGRSFKNLGDEILTDEDVLGLCKAAGGGKKLDALSERPTTWTYLSEIGPTSVSVRLRGREVAASFELADAQRGTERAAGAGAAPSSKRKGTAELAAALGEARHRDPRAPARTEPEGLRVRATRRSLRAPSPTSGASKTADALVGSAVRGDQSPTRRQGLGVEGRRRSYGAFAAALDAAAEVSTRAPARAASEARSKTPAARQRISTPRSQARTIAREEPAARVDPRLERVDDPKPRSERPPRRRSSPAVPRTLGTLELDSPELDLPPPRADVEREEPSAAETSSRPTRRPPARDHARSEPPAAASQATASPASRAVPVPGPGFAAPAPFAAAPAAPAPIATTPAATAPFATAPAEPARAQGATRLRPGAEAKPDASIEVDAELSQLVARAARRGASDLHLASGRPARARIGGVLTSLDGDERIRTTADLDRWRESVLPPRLASAYEASGSADFAIDLGPHGRVRVSVSRTLGGSRLALRLLPSKAKTVAELGLPEEIIRALDHHQGLVVVAGPTGHGKTSTLAALVDHVNETRASHVITIEDPIEIVQESKRSVVSQREVGRDAKSFARALEGALRQDPDVVVVGELRDTETVRMALAASETGHLVLVTMNTPSAARAIEHLIDLFPTDEQPQVRITLSAALRLVTCQRLVPGKSGGARHVAVEILPGGMALGSLIRDNKTYQLPALMQRGRGAGITRLDDSLADLVRGELVDKADALAASPTPDNLLAMLDGRDVATPAAALEELTQEDSKLKVLLQRAGAIFGAGRKDGDR